MEFPNFLLSKLNSPADISFLVRKDTASLLKNMQSWCLTDEGLRELHQLIALAEEGLGYAIYKSIEHAKKELSSQEETLFRFHHIAGIDIEEKISQEDFLTFSSGVTEKIIGSLQEVMNQAGVKATDIELVCLTGGTAQLKSIRQAFIHIFGEEKIQQFRFFHSIINGLADHARELL